MASGIACTSKNALGEKKSIFMSRNNLSWHIQYFHCVLRVRVVDDQSTPVDYLIVYYAD